MNTKARIILIAALVLLAGAALVAVTWAAPGNAPLAPGGSPTVVAYQGEVQVGGSPYTGSGYFKFAVVNAAGTTTYWSNDGTGTGGAEPTAAVQLAVSDGLFSVLLGDTTLGGMSQPLTADVFDQPSRYLRVWFSSDNATFDQLAPDTRIAAVPYALQAQEAVDADTVDGLHASELGADYQNVVVVAKSGGDYTTVQAAIDSITDAAADNAYLVWVAPGVYSETVTMKPYVHLQGAGQEATVITSTASSSDWPRQPTLVLASDTSLRDLTVGNSGTGNTNTGLLAMAGMTRTLVADVTARVLGSGVNNYAIVMNGSGVGITLQQVTALAENGSILNEGLLNEAGAAATLRGGSFAARGGASTYGIFTHDSGTTLEADGISALGEDGSTLSYGMENHDGGVATLRGGSFTGRGGNQASGVQNTVSSTLTAEGIAALGENSSTENYGLVSSGGVTTTLRGGSFTGRGGTGASGIYNSDNGATLKAANVTALGEDGSGNNYGLANTASAAAVLRGSSFTGRGGTVDTYGILNSDSDTVLEAEGVTALGENNNSYNFGLHNLNGAEATLRNASFTGRGGQFAQGIANGDSGTTLEAENVTALGENSGDASYGLLNRDSAEATLRSGAFIARTAVTETHGIHNDGTLQAESVSALGENGGSNYGLYNLSGTTEADSSQLTGSNNGLYLNSGTVNLGVSRLDNGATKSGGTLACFQVYDGSYSAYTCP